MIFNFASVGSNLPGVQTGRWFTELPSRSIDIAACEIRTIAF